VTIPRHLAGAGLVALAAVCFGTLGPISRYADEAGVDPLTLVTWRAWIGAAVVALFLVARQLAGRRPFDALRTVPRRDLLMIGMAAGLNTILNLAVFVAFLRVSIALALLIFYLYPALVALASVIWFGERLDRIRWAALSVSLSGVVLVVAGAGITGRFDLLGIVLAFVASVAQMGYVLAARHGFSRIPAAQAAALTMAGAGLIYVAGGVLLGAAATLGTPLASGEALGVVLLAGTLGAGIPTFAFITGIRWLGAPRAAIVATLEPVVGVVLAALLLNEQPAVVQLLGGVLIVAAAVALQLGPGAEPAEHEAVEPQLADRRPAS
jgi:DME family drug/metabolite transporter